MTNNPSETNDSNMPSGQTWHWRYMQALERKSKLHCKLEDAHAQRAHMRRELREMRAELRQLEREAEERLEGALAALRLLSEFGADEAYDAPFDDPDND